MSPEDLAGYIHTQEEAVREFSVHPEKPLCALEPRLSFWEIFRDFFWGKGLGISQEEKVERGDEPVDLDDSPTRSLLWTFSKGRKIRIRSSNPAYSASSQTQGRLGRSQDPSAYTETADPMEWLRAKEQLVASEHVGLYRWYWGATIRIEQK